MKKKIKNILSMILVTILLLALMPAIKANAATSGTTDFSGATYSWSDDTTDPKLVISNVTAIDGHYYYFCITDSSTAPSDITDSTDADGHLTENTDGDLVSSGLGNYIALNQDLYLWVWEYSSSDDIDFELVVEGEELDRPDIPTYLDAISSTSLIAYSDSQILLNYPFGSLSNDERILNIKIGKISDNTILNELYNEDSSALADLLSYAKSAETVYKDSLVANTINRIYRI